MNMPLKSPLRPGGERDMPRRASARAPIKLIYIAGYGRSGTTLLDIALGEHPAILGAGEVTTIARHVWDRNEYCACGASVRDCGTWRDIVGRWRAGEDGTFLTRYRKAQEHSEMIVSPRRILRGGPRSFYATATARLLRSAAAATGRGVIVDSSKLPGRALALARLPGVELYVVHVVRDGRGVAWSLMKGHKREVERGVQRELKPKPLFYTALRWAIVNAATEWLRFRVGPGHSLRVRYEDFVADMGGTVDRIVAMVGETPLERERTGNAPLSPQHQVAGSRHRMQKSIEIRADETWKTQMPARQQIAFSLCCGALLGRYGYALAPQ